MIIDKIIFIVFFTSLCSLTPIIIFADSYQTLAPIQGTTSVAINGGPGLSDYLNQIYILGVSICTGLAVLMIVIGGVEYMGSGSWGGKQDGKDRIEAAILGLIVALGSYVILNTLDTRFLNTNLNVQQAKTDGAIAVDKITTSLANQGITVTPPKKQPDGSQTSTLTNNNPNDTTASEIQKVTMIANENGYSATYNTPSQNEYQNLINSGVPTSAVTHTSGTGSGGQNDISPAGTPWILMSSTYNSPTQPTNGGSSGTSPNINTSPTTSYPANGEYKEIPVVWTSIK